MCYLGQGPAPETLRAICIIFWIAPSAIQPDASSLLSEGGVQHWLARWRLHTFSNLFPDGQFLALAYLGHIGSLTSLDVFFYLRLSCQRVLASFLREPTSLPAMDTVFQLPSPARLITRLYATMQTNHPVISPHACAEWSAALGVEEDEVTWRYCCTQICMLSLNYRLWLIHIKFLNRIHRTPAQLCKMKMSDNVDCAMWSA